MKELFNIYTQIISKFARKIRKRGKFDFLRSVVWSHSKCYGCISNFTALCDNVRGRVDGKFCEKPPGDKEDRVLIVLSRKLSERGREIIDSE